MVSRDQLLKYGALLLIVVFVGETVFLGLSTARSSDADGGPSPTPLSFSGTAQVRGKVLQLGYAGLAVCGAATKLDEELRTYPGVRNALFASPDVLAIQFEKNASLDFVESRVADACQAPLFRSAGMDLIPAQLELNTSTGSQDVSARQLDAYFSNQGFAGFQAFVSPSLDVGDEAELSVTVVVQDNQFVSVTAQQLESDVLSAWGGTASPAAGASASPEPSVNASAGNASASASPVASGSNASQ
ncbi:hypothetical protein HYV43_06160 [Candidatus Micrarchaeota archaeon]|nr:hypothetical protein [Candidatus Micrarchaeota archaeon]